MNAYNKSVKDIILIEQKMFSAVGSDVLTSGLQQQPKLSYLHSSLQTSPSVMFGSLAFTRRSRLVRQASATLSELQRFWATLRW
jgi:hypothetical protein